MARRKSLGAEDDAATSSDAAHVILPADLGYCEARDLHARLLGIVGAHRVLINASAVERVSTAGILVIASFLAAREAMTPPAAVEGATGPFVDAFSELGLFATMMRMEFLT